MAWQLIAGSHKSAPTSDMFDWQGLTLTGFQKVLVLVDGVTVGTDGAFLEMQLYTASTLRNTGYRWAASLRSSGGSTDSTGASAQASARVLGGSSSTWGIGNAASECGSCRIEISNIDAAVYKQLEANGSMVAPSGASVRHTGSGLLEQTGTVDGIRLLMSSGTMTAGTATLYGLPTS